MFLDCTNMHIVLRLHCVVLIERNRIEYYKPQLLEQIAMHFECHGTDKSFTISNTSADVLPVVFSQNDSFSRWEFSQFTNSCHKRIYNIPSVCFQYKVYPPAKISKENILIKLSNPFPSQFILRQSYSTTLFLAMTVTLQC